MEEERVGLEQLSELRAAEIPEELAITERYLTNRWGHMGDVPQVATGTTAGGEQWVRNKKVIVGRTGDGKRLYAHSFAMAHRFRGELFNAGNPANMQGATATVSDFTPTGSGLSYETIDLEDLPGAGPGQFSGAAGNPGGSGGGGSGGGGGATRGGQ